MEEKKVTKISLSTFFLILAVIVIFIMGYFIYKFYNEKATESKKSIELQAQVNSLNGTVGELQGKIDNISSTINSNSKIENTTSNDKTISNGATDNETKTYLYSSIKGSYKGTAKDSDETNVNRNYELYLYENGTFKYVNYTEVETGKIGNYNIVDDTIVLNYLFNTGSDAGLTATEGKKTLKINADNSIADSNPDHSSSSSLILKKVSSSEDVENANNVNYLINNYYISNKSDS